MSIAPYLVYLQFLLLVIVRWRWILTFLKLLWSFTRLMMRRWRFSWRCGNKAILNLEIWRQRKRRRTVRRWTICRMQVGIVVRKMAPLKFRFGRRVRLSWISPRKSKHWKCSFNWQNCLATHVIIGETPSLWNIDLLYLGNSKGLPPSSETGSSSLTRRLWTVCFLTSEIATRMVIALALCQIVVRCFFQDLLSVK